MATLELDAPARQTAEPNAVQIRAALKVILGSAAFSHAPMLTAFLTFVVEATLNGHGDRLKAYTIAVDGLGRKPNFNSDTDAIVRVHAIRTRQALKRYYMSAGAEDAIVIALPRRRYVPAFSKRLPLPETPRIVLPRFLATGTKTTLTSSHDQAVSAWIEKRLRALVAADG